MSHKTTFLRILIGALVLSAAIGIFIFLIGEFGEIESKILLTTLSIGAFSLTALCCSSIFDLNKLQHLSKLGMLFSIIGFFISFIAIWEITDMDYMGKPLVIIFVLSISSAHISLLQLINPKSSKVELVRTVTFIFISIVSFMLIVGVLFDFELGDLFLRLIGVFAILDVLGTIATPLVNRMSE